MDTQQIQQTDSSTFNQSGLVNNLEVAINDALVTITSAKTEIKSKDKTLKDTLGLNAEYAEAVERLKESQGYKKQVQEALIAASSDLRQLSLEVKTLKSEKKVAENSLSDYLVEFEKQTGQLSFLTESGQVIEFERVAKLRIREQ